MFGCIYGKPLPTQTDIVSGSRVKGLAVTLFIICANLITFTWSAAFDHCVARPFSLFLLGKWVC